MQRSPVQPFYYFLCKELGNVKIMFTAALIGGSINWFGTGDFFATPMGFVIPYLVQAFSRSSVGYKNRFQALLALLPRERKDPALVIDYSGNIVLADGKSKEFCKKHGIENITDFLGESSIDGIIEQFESKRKPKRLEYYVAMTNQWFKVEVKQLIHTKGDDTLLVWLEETTSINKLHERILSISGHSDQVLRQLEDFTQRSDIYQKLAPFILGMGYQATFIALENGDCCWVGQATKQRDNQNQLSENIVLPKNSKAPILLSRTTKHIVEATMFDFADQEAFEKAYPFDQRIKDFIGEPIHSFLNFHEGDCSIIAFNKSNPDDHEDKLFLHSLVTTVKSLLFLANLAIRNEEQFLQKIMGLCSAAEFSDEITGKHIIRVNKYSELIATHMKLPSRTTHAIGQVAALHDIGKVAIPEIIKIPGKYTEEQRTQMQMHSIYGAKVIETMMAFSSQKDEKLELAHNIALHHHQYWNGKGYPNLIAEDGSRPALTTDIEDYKKLKPLKGTQIPLEALIVGVADSYDALRSPRQYKKEFSHEKTIAILTLDDRTGVTGEDRFGPKVWAAFKALEDEMAKIYDEMQN